MRKSRQHSDPPASEPLRCMQGKASASTKGTYMAADSQAVELDGLGADEADVFFVVNVVAASRGYVSAD